MPSSPLDRSESTPHVRDPFANPAAVRAARERPMSERLELALSWNAVAAELRSGLARDAAGPASRRRSGR